MNPTTNKQLDDLIKDTIIPAIGEDFDFTSIEEAKEAMKSLIEKLQNVDLSHELSFFDFSEEEPIDIDDLESDLDD